MPQNAGERAMQAASQLERIGFVDFTVDLVKGVYETIVQASMDQLNNYAELVNKISIDLATYQAEMIGADNSQELKNKIDNYIKEVVELDPQSTNPYQLDEKAGTNIKNNFAGISVVDKTATPPVNKTINDYLQPATAPATGYSLAVNDLKALVEEKLKASVKQSQDLLKTILKIGMQKVVVTNGEIMTKLTFHIDAQDNTSKESNKANEKASGWGIGGGLSGKVSGIGKIIGASVGASLSG